MKPYFAITIAITVLLTTQGECDRTRDRMYEEVKGASACFRRMNATHQTGCSSGRQGSTGIVHLVGEMQDLRDLIKSGTGDSYVPVLPVDLLTKESALILKTSSKINGLVLFKNNESQIDSYSHEDECPNRNFNGEDTCEVNWNRDGTGLLNEDFPFPIFYVSNQTELKTISDCYYKFNNVSFEKHSAVSLCSIELSSFMLAAIDTPTCLRRSSPFFNLNTVKLCDPLGSLNVWSSLFPIGNATEESKSKYIILTVRLDTTSMFIDQEKGAINPISSIVTFLYVAKLLKSMIPEDQNYEKNIIFLMLSGETYDYIGSQRFVYELKEDAFPNTENPIKPEDIEMVIELNQMNINDSVYVYGESKFVEKLKKYSKRIKIEEIADIRPPSSVQTFEKNNISGIVITDHNRSSYKNKFYNSILDDAENLGYKHYENPSEIPEDSIQFHTAEVSEIFAKALFEEVTGTNPKINIDPDYELVDELYNCYLKNASCRAFSAVGKKRARDAPMGLYVGVTASRSPLVLYSGLALAWVTSEVIGDGPCPPRVTSYVYKYYNMSRDLGDSNATVCRRVCMNFTEAVSPAFIIKDYDWSSNEYSSWTESVWKELTVRVFLKPSPGHEKMTFAVGSAAMALAFALVYFVSSRSHVLFASGELAAPTRC